MLKKEQIERISKIVQPILLPHDAFWVGMEVHGERGTVVLQIFIDTDLGITADQCADVSRGLASELDRENLIAGRYRLEVSSPGLDRPLTLHRQFRKNIGRQLKVVPKLENGSQPAVGELTEVTESSITLMTSIDHSISFPLDAVEEAYVLPRLKR
ncbi:MAG TPA: ribosome maturation factor RimP [Bacteroidota bacterium]|nr:ribosome maturation factor RimP [Bacteroidota bacterium]